MIRSTLALGALLASTALLPGQQVQNVGIYLSRGISTISGVLCGFDCNSPTIVGTAQAQVTDTIDTRVIGDLGLPGYVILGFGPAFQPCPGLVIPSLGNGLMMLPPSVAFATGVPALGAYRPGGCNTGFALVLTLQIPVAASGATVTFQGLVFASGTPAFTRPIELSIL